MGKRKQFIADNMYSPHISKYLHISGGMFKKEKKRGGGEIVSLFKSSKMSLMFSLSLRGSIL